MAANADVFEDRMGRNFEAIHQALQAERTRGTLKGVRVTRNMLAWTLPSGPVAMLRSRLSLERFSPITHKEEGASVPLAPVSAILYGKIHGRILSAGRFVQRDVYDLAVVCLVDKGAVGGDPCLIPAEGRNPGRANRSNTANCRWPDASCPAATNEARAHPGPRPASAFAAYRPLSCRMVP